MTFRALGVVLTLLFWGSPARGQDVFVVADAGANVKEYGFALSVKGDTLVVGAPWERGTYREAGAAYFYKLGINSGSGYNLLWRIVGQDSGRGRFGISVDHGADRVAIGAWGEEAVHIYNAHSPDVGAEQVVIDNGRGSYGVGFSTSISDRLLFIGDTNWPGAVQIYSLESGSWTLVDYISGSNGILWFNGTHLFSGVGGNDGGVGVYESVGAEWSQTQLLPYPDPNDIGSFGRSISASSSTLAIGAPSSAGGRGAVHLYELTDSGWKHDTVLEAPDLGSAGFGWSVCFFDDTLIVGAPRAEVAGLETGAVRLFKRDQGTWTERATLISPEGNHQYPAHGSEFGHSVSANQHWLAVGAPNDHTTGFEKGAAWVFSPSPDFAWDTPGLELSVSDWQNVNPTQEVIASWNLAGPNQMSTIELSADRNFQSVIHAVTLAGSTIDLKDLISFENEYFLRVRWEGTDAGSHWSLPIHLTTSLAPPGTPQLVQPSNEQTNVGIPVTLQWNTENPSHLYRMQVASDSLFSELVHEVGELSSSSILVELQRGREYFWRVKAKANEIESDWSETWRFTTIPFAPPAPQILAPSISQITTTRPLLEWETNAHISLFQVQVSTALSFSLLEVDATLNEGHLQVSDLLTPGLYFWRVRATNEGGWGEWSNTGSFTTQNHPPAAVIGNSGISGQAPYQIVFDGSGSSDLDRDPLLFAWDLGDGTTSTETTVAHIYTTAGEHKVVLTVSDGLESASDSVTVSIASGVATEALELPESYELRPAYPNPFNPTTTISYALPVASEVRITVTDLLGRPVATLLHGDMVPAGNHTVQFEAGQLSSGTYLLTMEAGSFVDSRQLILLK